jgi:hypothetical protein
MFSADKICTTFRPLQGFSWAWTRNDKPVASINVQMKRHSVTLRYRSRSYGEDWTDVEQRVTTAWTPCRFGGERPWFICSVYANGTYCGRQVTKLYDAGRLFACRHCFGLPTRASRNRPIYVVCGRRKKSGCDWVVALVFSITSRKSLKARTGGPTSACAAFMI